MIELKNVKLIIWDLDETFWQGILSEGDIQKNDLNIQLIKDLTDRGIINSICSKNDYEKAKLVLTEMKVWDYFVFPQISWNPKGQIIQQMIKQMHLRPCNVLFIDDNPSNLKEAQFYENELLIATPKDIVDIMQQCSEMERTDLSHDRLNRYKILEKKQNERNDVSSNEEFFYYCAIIVKILENCNDHRERIHELILRTNQLNYTKNRLTFTDLIKLLNNPNASCAYITVSDKFGDYGISGFYSIEDGKLTNFLFSCRTMGMGVEQYIYAKLGFPYLEVVGEVAYVPDKNTCPDWISECNDNETKENTNKIDNNRFRALIKGPCDMEQILGYIKEENLFEPEFTYINPETGVSIESYNHTWQIVESYSLPDEQKSVVIGELPFASDKFFSKKFYSKEYNIVFYSLFTDPNLGLYKRKKTGEIIAFGEYCFDLTDTNNWDGYICGDIFNANCVFTKENLSVFKDKYEYIGRISPKQVVENLDFIRNHMDKSVTLVLFLGVEFPYPNNNKKCCEDRHEYHKELNQLVRNWAKTSKKVKLLEFGEYVTSPNEMLNNINHFIKPVYYKMANRVIDLVNEENQNPVKRRSWLYMQKTYFKQASPIFAKYLKIKERIAKLIRR